MPTLHTPKVNFYFSSRCLISYSPLLLGWTVLIYFIIRFACGAHRFCWLLDAPEACRRAGLHFPRLYSTLMRFNSLTTSAILRLFHRRWRNSCYQNGLCVWQSIGPSLSFTTRTSLGRNCRRDGRRHRRPVRTSAFGTCDGTPTAWPWIFSPHSVCPQYQHALPFECASPVHLYISEYAHCVFSRCMHVHVAVIFAMIELRRSRARWSYCLRWHSVQFSSRWDCWSPCVWLFLWSLAWPLWSMGIERWTGYRLLCVHQSWSVCAVAVSSFWSWLTCTTFDGFMGATKSTWVLHTFMCLFYLFVRMNTRKYLHTIPPQTIDQVGLTMDYDMFLSTHVFDLRKKHGFSTRHAILKGVVCSRIVYCLRSSCSSFMPRTIGTSLHSQA